MSDNNRRHPSDPLSNPLGADLQQRLLLQRLSARNAELESWLAMLVMQFGVQDGPNQFRMQFCGEHAGALRAKSGTPELGVSIEYDPVEDVHILRVL